MTKPRRTKLEIQAAKILKAAREAGLEESYFFETTFARYQRQLKLLAELEEILDDSPALVTKSYVKGRENVYANPAITQYNSTADAANRTLASLLKIVESYKLAESANPAPDALMEYINSRP